ncbi:ThiF family adenylyltransferase [Ancylobacter vacuolatus]|uniref:ThiF family adenylyltransferase n=1 Tax=Ancylobacter vacuolatus TaxID=223389 RepID=UPI0036436924
MVALDITILEQHMDLLRPLLPARDAPEAAAYMLLGASDIATDPWTGQPRLRLISHRVVDIPSADRISASPVHVTWSTTGFMRLLGDATIAGKVPAIVHTHPGSHAFFSDQDDRNERELARTASLKGVRGLVSIVLGGDGSICARMWTDADGYSVADAVQIVGGRFLRHASNGDDFDAPHLDRQRRLFGDRFNETLRSLRVCVVGCGGTGSPVALLLARLGVGRIYLIDNDNLAESNLNRVHGSRRDDVGMPKVDILKREIEAMGVDCHVVTSQAWVKSEEVRDALKSADFVFGCTDDNSGRIFINRLAYFYGIALIDVGLRMVTASETYGNDLNGRVTTALPGRPCLICSGVVNAARANDEDLERSRPEEFQKRKAEAYVMGGGDPAPAVVTFTTEMAATAVNEMIAALTGFHGNDGMVPNRVRRWHARDERFTAHASREGCPVCNADGSRGAGDVVPFLDAVS